MSLFYSNNGINAIKVKEDNLAEVADFLINRGFKYEKQKAEAGRFDIKITFKNCLGLELIAKEGDIIMKDEWDALSVMSESDFFEKHSFVKKVDLVTRDGIKIAKIKNWSPAELYRMASFFGDIHCWFKRDCCSKDTICNNETLYIQCCQWGNACQALTGEYLVKNKDNVIIYKNKEAIIEDYPEVANMQLL